MKNEIPLHELQERIKQHLDELELLEALDLTVEELVELLADQIELKYDELLEILPEDKDVDSY